MRPRGVNREGILEALEALGEPTKENIRTLSRQTGVPESEIYGVASFYHLIEHVDRRVCTSLTCRINGAAERMAELKSQGLAVDEVSCLGQCDRPVAILDEHHAPIGGSPPAHVTDDDPELPMNLGGDDPSDYRALARFREMDIDDFLEELETSGLQGRGGAGFPAHIKWRS
ncbi:MAG: NAD(P)H-dependent oxidoreductase subunit E, partial [Myxococcota bacterium]|nr:NAD(P)H-dependent oxidoreductase subunit E [Myxococcota bacterium]